MKVSVENCKANTLLFGRTLAEKLGVLTENVDNRNMFYFSGDNNGFVEEFAEDLNAVNLAELAVIEKVGVEAYAVALYVVIFYNADPKAYAEMIENNKIQDSWRLSDKALVKIATADAPTRLCALLLCLNIEEIEEIEVNEK